MGMSSAIAALKSLALILARTEVRSGASRVVIATGYNHTPLLPSWGPFAGAARRGHVPLWIVNTFPYRPLFAVARCIPGFEDALNRYADWCTPAGYRWTTRPTLVRTR
jgi:hypothetical protein